MNAIVPTGNTALTPTSMESAIQLAEMMARGKLVPSHLHNSPGDCLMVIEASMRWQMSPFAVAQCTSVIQGKLMFEGKLVAAALNASGILSSRLDYDFSGEKEQRAVTVRGTLRGETKPREVTVFLADAKTANSMWTKQPDQQLVYAGTRVWARRHAPEVMLGVYAPEEFDQAMPFNGTTLEGETEAPAPSRRDEINREVPLRAAAAPMPRGASVRAPAERTKDQWDSWLDKFSRAAQTLYHRSDLEDMARKDTVKDALATGPEWVRDEIARILDTNYRRLPAEPETDADDELGEILGQEKLGAG